MLIQEKFLLMFQKLITTKVVHATASYKATVC